MRKMVTESNPPSEKMNILEPADSEKNLALATGRQVKVNPLPIVEAGSRHPETGKPACMGRNRGRASYCKHEPGFGTDHPGVGRCKFHAGCTSAMEKRHRYDTVKFSSRVQQLFDDFRNDPQPYNMLNELAMLRAIAVNFAEDHELIQSQLKAWAVEMRKLGFDIGKRPPQLPDLLAVRKVLGDIGGMIERMHRIEQRGLISILVFNRIWEEVGAILADEIEDPDLVRRIELRLMKIRVPNMYKAGRVLKKEKEKYKTVDAEVIS